MSAGSGSAPLPLLSGVGWTGGRVSLEVTVAVEAAVLDEEEGGGGGVVGGEEG